MTPLDKTLMRSRKIDRREYAAPSSSKPLMIKGAGMDHTFMATFATDLAAIGIATLRFQFPCTHPNARRSIVPDISSG